MTDNKLLHTKNGNIIITRQDMIENALEQKKQGIKPCYAFLDAKYKNPCLPAGWLVYSTWDDGCGVVYPLSSGDGFGIVTGWQCEFAIV